MNKEEIEKAKEDFNFFNEGDYITREMSTSKEIILEYIAQLETSKQKLIDKLLKDKQELTEELKYNITKREARLQLNLVDKYLEIMKEEKNVK